MIKRISVSLILSPVLLLGGCAVTNQLHSDMTYSGLSREAVSLDNFGIGVLTPSAPTGKESDRQALGDAISTALRDLVPDAHVMALHDMLSAINRSGLAGAYAEMLDEYEETGILERERLRQVGEAGDVRYLAKFNLGDFSQSTDKRLSIAGIRMFDTWKANIRVHMEIWDSVTGELAWQGNEELTFAREGVKEKPVSFSQVAKLTAEHLVNRVGESGTLSTDEEPEAFAAAVQPAEAL